MAPDLITAQSTFEQIKARVGTRITEREAVVLMRRADEITAEYAYLSKGVILSAVYNHPKRP